ncbi:MAG: hypothetical protein E7812_13295 [Phenylobacterium sp.]|nr:MAG: hypothetical protein E7812_13295 [Phenylobacterium sp.]
MTRFSPSDAAFEGFRVIGRHWRVVAGWALFNVVAEVAMIVLTVVIAIGLSAAAGGAGATQLSGALGGVIWLFGFALIVAMLTAGAYRLMLRPEEPAFLHLRLGRDELRLIAVWLVMLIASFLFIGACAFVQRFAGRASLIVWLIALVVAVFLALRFALAPVASFADRRLGFAASWRLSRGRVWSLLGMAVLTACFLGLVFLASLLVLLPAVIATSGFSSLFEAMSEADALKAHPGLYLGETAFELVLMPVMIVLAAAPAAAAYRALTAEPILDPDAQA